MPPVPVPETSLGALARVDRFDTYAIVRCGELYAEVERFAYWEESYGNAPVEVSFEVRIYGLPEHGGCCDVSANDADGLLDLTQVSFYAAMLLEEARSRLTPV
ncbi:hypothetical protein ACKUT9_06900 [Mycobacterium seoulense]|uniref:hypothetical protein n=1 Tax=Mycobacterium seoulense TaxID=386911 RepID=UPI003CF89FB8